MFFYEKRDFFESFIFQSIHLENCENILILYNQFIRSPKEGGECIYEKSVCLTLCLDLLKLRNFQVEKPEQSSDRCLCDVLDTNMCKNISAWASALLVLFSTGSAKTSTSGTGDRTVPALFYADLAESGGL